jgi:hypothetical protein
MMRRARHVPGTAPQYRRPCGAGALDVAEVAEGLRAIKQMGAEQAALRAKAMERHAEGRLEVRPCRRPC